MSTTTRYAVYFIVCAATLIGIYFSIPQFTYTPKGLLLPAKQAFHALTSNDIALVRTPPRAAVPVGYINVERHVRGMQDSNAAFKEIGEFAKAKAASAGANLVQIDQAGVATAQQTGSKSLAIAIFKARAFRLQNS